LRMNRVSLEGNETGDLLFKGVWGMNDTVNI
jgi:hypothetical protein